MIFLAIMLMSFAIGAYKARQTFQAVRRASIRVEPTPNQQLLEKLKPGRL